MKHDVAEINRRRWLSLRPEQRAAIAAQVEAMRADVRSRKWALGTERSYCMWVRRFGLWLELSPHAKELADPTAQVSAYLKQLVTGPSPRSGTTLKQARNAFVHHFKCVLKTPLARLEEIPLPKISQRLPHVLTHDQVRELVAAIIDTEAYPFRLVGRLLYYCGMRISDLLNLRVQDINWEKCELVLRAGKGDKDRVVPLPSSIMAELRAQVERVKLLWLRDQLDGIPVQLPDAVYNKCPRYGLSWQWFFVFAAPNRCRHPRLGHIVRWRLHDKTLQTAMRGAAERAGLLGLATPHRLRHAYATHLHQAGVDIRTIQEILGHVSVDTTMVYTHTAVRGDRVRASVEALAIT